MDTIMIERKSVDKLTTLETALRVYDKEEFLATKKELWKNEFDEETQTKIWKDYHDLMNKARGHNLERADFECIQRYLLKQGCFELVSDEKRMFFPTEILRNEEGQIVKVKLDTIDNEVTKKWFLHICDIHKGRVNVQVCAAEDCPNLFSQNRKSKRFCSEACRNRDWQTKHRTPQSNKPL